MTHRKVLKFERVGLDDYGSPYNKGHEVMQLFLFPRFS